MEAENKEIEQIKAERKELARVRSFWCIFAICIGLLICLITEIVMLFN